MVLLNLLVGVFMRLTESELPQVCPRSYADDISSSSTSAAAIGQFLNLAGSFATVTCQRLKPCKCKLWGTSQALRLELAKLRLKNSPLELVAELLISAI